MTNSKRSKKSSETTVQSSKTLNIVDSAFEIYKPLSSTRYYYFASSILVSSITAYIMWFSWGVKSNFEFGILATFSALMALSLHNSYKISLENFLMRKSNGGNKLAGQWYSLFQVNFWFFIFFAVNMEIFNSFASEMKIPLPVYPIVIVTVLTSFLLSFFFR